MQNFQNQNKLTNKQLEEKFLSNNVSFDYEKEIQKQIEKEMQDAKKFREKQLSKENFYIETDFSKVKSNDKYDKNTIYKVFNRTQKTESYVNGEQAEHLIKYTNEYVVTFDHRIVEA